MHAASASAAPSAPPRRLLRRLGALGFAFFFLKGIAWLVVPAVLWFLRG